LPRDASGTFSNVAGTLVNTGDTIEPSQHNPAFNDVANALTGSLSRDGLGGMRAPLEMGGNRVTNLGAATLPSDAVRLDQLTSTMALPVGAIVDYAGSAAPTGWLLCYGQAISRVTYAALFTIIGTAYGTGDGSTTFNLPDLRGRVGAGKDDMGGANAARLNVYGGTTLGNAFGNQIAFLAEHHLPPHSHGVNDPGHVHDLTLPQRGGNNNATSPPASFVTDDAAAGSATGTTTSATTGITTQATGGGLGHDNVQPTMILSKIIKVDAG
jgi:microcystin-dependent protein